MNVQECPNLNHDHDASLLSLFEVSVSFTDSQFQVRRKGGKSLNEVTKFPPMRWLSSRLPLIGMLWWFLQRRKNQGGI